MVQWTFGGSPVSSSARIERKFEDNKSFLNIDKVTKEDQGWYTCHVDNGIGQSSNASIFLIVKRELGPAVNFLSILTFVMHAHAPLFPLNKRTSIRIMHCNVFFTYSSQSPHNLGSYFFRQALLKKNVEQSRKRSSFNPQVILIMKRKNFFPFMPNTLFSLSCNLVFPSQ